MNKLIESQSRPVARFLGIFTVVYVVAILPWPGWSKMYGSYFQAFGRLVFARDEGPRILQFTPVFQGASPPIDTQITLANRDLLDRNGRGRAVVLAVSSRNVGWVPTAMVVALVLATPLPLHRRGWALLCGLCAIHGVIFLGVAAHIWNNSDASTGLHLLVLNPFWKCLIQGLETTTAQLGLNFAAPVLVWIVVGFRREDGTGILGGAPRRPNIPSPRERRVTERKIIVQC